MACLDKHEAIINSFDSFETFSNTTSDGITKIIGLRDGSSKMVAVKFDVKKFSAHNAREWLKDNNIIASEFNEAVENKDSRKDSVRNIRICEAQIK